MPMRAQSLAVIGFASGYLKPAELTRESEDRPGLTPHDGDTVGRRDETSRRRTISANCPRARSRPAAKIRVRAAPGSPAINSSASWTMDTPVSAALRGAEGAMEGKVVRAARRTDPRRPVVHERRRMDQLDGGRTRDQIASLDRPAPSAAAKTSRARGAVFHTVRKRRHRVRRLGERSVCRRGRR